MTAAHWWRRYVVHPLQAAGAFALYGVFAILPMTAASAVGGWLAGAVGPLLGISRRARRNLRRAMPDLGEAEIAAIVRGMWQNLGRVLAEHPHLGKFDFGPGGNVHLIGGEHIDNVRDSGKPGIFLSGHIGNWELLPLPSSKRGLPLDVVYRAPNNPLIEWLYRHGRTAVASGQIPKGPLGARQLLKALRDGHSLGMLVDQKMNDGIAVPFFGRDAMTAPAAAELALRFGVPVMLSRIERVDGIQLRMTVTPPLAVTPTGDRQRDVRDLMTRINAQLEAWIRERPDQWLWLHNRWPADDEPEPPN